MKSKTGDCCGCGKRMGETEHKLAKDLFKWDSISQNGRTVWLPHNIDDAILTRYYNEGITHAESFQYGMYSAQGMLLVISKMRENGYSVRIDSTLDGQFMVKFFYKEWFMESTNRTLSIAVVNAALNAIMRK